MKLYFFIFPLLVISTNGYAQIKLKLGGLTGISNYKGDIVDQEFVPQKIGYTLGGMLEYQATPKISFETQLSYIRLAGDDADSKNRGVRGRAWSFESNLAEINLQTKWYPFNKTYFYERATTTYISPFVSGGLGVTFAVKRNLDASTSSRFLRISFPEPEDERVYLVFPLTLGFDISPPDFPTITISSGARYVYSDYIDKYSVINKLLF